MANPKSAVVAVARKRKRAVDFSKPVQLSTGFYALVKPVSVSLITEVQRAIPNPKVPTWFNESKQREEENPSHPDYILALGQADMARNMAATDAMIMFGITLVDENGDRATDYAEDGEWVDQLAFMVKHGMLDISEYDMDDPIEREFVFKKFIAIGAPDIEMLTSATVSQEDVETAEANFRSN